MRITIRTCGPGDAKALSLVGQATFLQTYAEQISVADILAHCADEHSEARYARWLASPDHRLFLAEQEATGAPVGFAMLSPPELQIPVEPGDIELKRLYLLHRFHGAGMGAGLMDAAIRAATGAGFTRLLLSVYSRNPNAIDFYARQGFAQAGVRKFRVGETDYDDLVLARSLGRTP